MPPNRMHEDFFQRIKNVNWESEPEVYWMAGEGWPYIINGGLGQGGTPEVGLYMSEDGKHWGGGSISGPGGFAGIYAGGWMREGLVKEGKPVWVLLGATGGSGVLRAASTYSTDGKNISDMVPHDQRHIMIRLEPSGSGKVAAVSGFSFPNWHEDSHKSSTGRDWQPLNFHPIKPDDGGIVLFQAATAGSAAVPEINTNTGPVLFVVSPDGNVDVNKLLMSSASAPLVPLSAAVATPFVGDAGPAQKSRDKVFIQGLTHIAEGKLRKGPWLGKTVKMTIKPYDTRQPAHGGPSIEVTDSKTGGVLGTTNCGIGRTITIAYGHYVFCVGGTNVGLPSRGFIASTDNGVDWVSTALGDTQINVLAVGPRK